MSDTFIYTEKIRAPKLPSPASIHPGVIFRKKPANLAPTSAAADDLTLIFQSVISAGFIVLRIWWRYV